uniref:Uncharacterized protein n=1 Tax=Panagrellus redivivus TaxID=6233 RepID=A0A7E4V372_PANRE
MHLTQLNFIIFFVVGAMETIDVGQEVEGGFEVLHTGPIQLIIPDILSFTIRNEAQCKGLFRICYVSDPKASRRELMDKYHNVGGSCPPGGYCTLKLEPEHNGVFGLAAERHHGNIYGIFVDGFESMCPRYIVDGRSNFTVIDVPDCPVIIDGARLPKEEVVKSDKGDSYKWLIIVCVGLLALL